MQKGEPVSSRRKLLFVCSSALHVKLFVPAIRMLLSSDDLDPVIVSLDTFYAGIYGDVASYVSHLNLAVPVKEVGVSRGGGSNRLIQVLGSIRSAHTHGVPIFRNLFSQRHVSLVIFCNDTGHAERAALRTARELNVPSLLVQDGFLFDQFSGGFVGKLRLAVRRLWLECGGRYLGGVPFGMGACDYVAVHGKAWAEIFRSRKCRQTKKLYIIGHPTLEIPATITGKTEGRDVTFFCTNYLSAHNDAVAHQDQITEVLTLRKLMSERYEMTATLRVKIHPADSEADYEALSHVAGIRLCKDDDVPGLIRSSWLCVTNISSVSLECLSCGRLCLMSGISLQKGLYRQLFYSLPGSKFVTWAEFLSYIEELETPSGYFRLLQVHRDTFLPYIDVQSGQSGVNRLVSLIYELIDDEALNDV